MVGLPEPRAVGQTSPLLSDDDHQYLNTAFELAEQGRGKVSPNPFVGCVIVADQQVVGQGFTQPPPGAHAEIQALAQAGSRAHGATVYVTLEPCAHHGRTPPCAQALIQAGVGRVVIALADPHAAAAGGAEQLQQAGITVETDVATVRAARQNEIFLHNVATSRPFVIAKTAISMDGFIADQAGASQWITGPAARRRGHLLRAEVDAVVVGSGTATQDDPLLTVRLPRYQGPQPLRVVLDRRGRLHAAGLRMAADDNPTPLLLAAPDPESVLGILWDRGVRSVLVEGGAQVLGAFLAARLIDRFEFHLGGLILGQGLSGVAGAFTLGSAPRLDLANAELCDGDVLVTAYPRRP
ncbi:MAG: bifunctional diaminohydroxyphosphoribosylaminopyrimidine deaminase/5-amino-6-(5-phosphoribosylamino)uracil reductase RibD [Euzebya sp.]